MAKEMFNYEFYDVETDELFFVQEENLEKAKEIANEYFNNPKFLGNVYDDVSAEMLGYDTY